jgi:hypothetical protein
MANDLENGVMDLIGENAVTPDVFDDDGITEIRSHLNDAIEEVALITGCHKRVWYVPLKANAYFYELNEARDKFGWFTGVYLMGTKRLLRQVSLESLVELDARWLYATGTPTHYVPLSFNRMIVWPAISVSADTLEVTAVAIPDRYTTDTDRVKLRKTHEWAVVNRAVSEFWATRGDAQSAARFFQQYAQEVAFPALYPEMSERRWQYRTEKR